MAVPGIKYDEPGGMHISSNSFPVRALYKNSEEGEGAWLVAHQAEQRRRFKAVLCAKPKTYNDIKEERKRTERLISDPEEPDDEFILDGFFLMKISKVDDPSDVCSINVSGKEISEYKKEDLALFDNVAYVNAAENYLTLDAFKGFPIIRELEVPINGLRGIEIEHGDFPYLEILDLSYNNLSKDDILPLGFLPQLKVLHLTGNGFSTLPPNFGKPWTTEEVINKKESYGRVPRFPMLEILMLDDNRLTDSSTFTSLSGLRKLKILNLQKNEISNVPHLQVVDGRHVSTPLRKSRLKSARSARSAQSTISKKKSNLESLESLSIAATEKTEPSSAREPQQSASHKSVAQDSVKTGVYHESSQSSFKPDNFSEITATFSQIFEDDFPPVPFPELRSIDLSHNKFAEEEALLAVAAWPLLSEIIIHDNPLTTQNSGNPLLLKRFLQDRLGVNIVRKRPGVMEKPHIEVVDRPSRHVNTFVPKVPKVSVDELLALEAPKTAEPSAPSRARSAPERPSSRPLPPITPQSPKSGDYEDDFIIEDEEEEGARREVNVEDLGADDEVDQKRNAFGDPFFMTQVDESEYRETQKVPQPPKQQKSRESDRRSRRLKKNVPKKFKGFEDLYEEDGETKPEKDDVPLPKDIQGSVRALHYTLNHPLMFKDTAVRLDKVSKPFEPYQRTSDNQKPIKTKAEKTTEVLDKIKKRNTVVEANLQDVLKEKKKKHSKDFPEAKKLMAEVQEKYNVVRIDSLQDAKNVRELIHSTISDVDRNKKRLGAIATPVK